jgi:hypothetical protein
MQRSVCSWTHARAGTACVAVTTPPARPTPRSPTCCAKRRKRRSTHHPASASSRMAAQMMTKPGGCARRVWHRDAHACTAHGVSSGVGTHSASSSAAGPQLRGCAAARLRNCTSPACHQTHTGARTRAVVAVRAVHQDVEARVGSQRLADLPHSNVDCQRAGRLAAAPARHLLWRIAPRQGACRRAAHSRRGTAAGRRCRHAHAHAHGTALPAVTRAASRTLQWRTDCDSNSQGL